VDKKKVGAAGFKYLWAMKAQNSKFKLSLDYYINGSRMQSFCLQHALDKKRGTSWLCIALNLLVFVAML